MQEEIKTKLDMVGVPAALYMAYRHLQGGMRTGVPHQASAIALIETHRRDLEQQRDLFWNMWRWHALAWLPFTIALQLHAYLRSQQISVSAMVFLAAMTFIAVRARMFFSPQLQRQIEELEARGRTSLQ